MTRRFRPSAVLAGLLATACGSSPSAPTPLATPRPPAPVPAELRPVIESMFLGSGPLVPRGGATGCVVNGHWHVFPPGTVRVRVSTTVPPQAREAIELAASQVGPVTRGVLQVAVETTTEPVPFPIPGEVTVASHPDPVSQGCSSAVGCTIQTVGRGGLLSAARAVLPPSQTTNAFVHDAIGHGVLGLCHIDGGLAGGPGLSLMSYGPGIFSDQIAPILSERDLRAIGAVYAAGFDRGGTRLTFAPAGLVDP